MKRKHIAAIGAALLLASTLSAYVAYRLGMRRAGAPYSSAAVSATAACVGIGDAAGLIGEDACISGRVLRVYTSRSGNTFLDFCTDYRQCPFTSVIFKPDREKFGDLDTLRGRRVEIRGLVTMYQERAEIIIRNPGQIRVLP